MNAITERLTPRFRFSHDYVPRPTWIPLPDRNLPFDQKWRAAEKLPPYQQAAFVRREVSNSISQMEDRETIMGTEFGRLALDRLDDILSGPLPLEVRDYLFYSDSGFGKLEYQNPEIRLSAGQWQDKQSWFDIWLGVKNKPEPTAVIVSGFMNGKRNSGSVNSYVLPLPKRDAIGREELEQYLKTASRLAVPREMIKFVDGVRARKRTPISSTTI